MTTSFEMNVQQYLWAAQVTLFMYLSEYNMHNYIYLCHVNISDFKQNNI